MQSNLAVAFVGCGGVAEQYLPIYRDLDWVRVVACIDAQPDVAESAAEFLAASQRGRNGWKPATTTEYAAALGRDVDVVIINTPNHLHRDQAVAALEAGKHVLLQKPVAPSLVEAEEIARAAHRARSRSGLYMSYFDHPLYHDLREMIASGFFGKVGHFYARLMHRHGQIWSSQALNGEATWRGSIAQTGGGCFIQLAVHYIHLFEWMSGQQVTRATAVAKNLHCPGLEGEDIAGAILEFESGAMATLDMGWWSQGEQLSIHGTDGSADYLNNHSLSLESRVGAFRGRVVHFGRPGGRSGPQRNLEVLPPSMGDVTNPFNQHRAFLTAIRDGATPFVSIASGVDDLRVVDAVYESAACGCAVTIAREARPAAPQVVQPAGISQPDQ
jgi:predicted dehydrogenase